MREKASYSVLIVDDERIVREGLAKSIDWEQLGFNVIGAYGDAISALEAIRTQKPNIVMTDIKMPIINGIELIRRSKKLSPHTEYVVMSGYQEFELVSSAMELGVKHYLLKPCSDSKIVGTLFSVKSDLDARAYQEAYEQNMRDSFTKMIPMVKEQFVRDFICDRLFGEKELSYFMDLLDIPKQTFKIVVFQPENALPYEQICGISNMMSEAFCEKQLYQSIFTKDHIAAILLDTDGESLERGIENVRSIFKRCCNMETLVVTTENGKFEDLPSLYMQALGHMNDPAFFTAAIEDNDLEPKLIPRLNARLEKTSIAIKCGDVSAAKEELDGFFASLNKNVQNLVFFRIYCFALLFSIQCYCGADESFENKDIMSTLNKMGQHSDIQKYVEALIGSIVKRRAVFFAKRQSGIVEKMIQYVEGHYTDEDLSLTYIANSVLHMDVGYASRIFSRETGTNFSTYLLSVRMNKAKKLLCQGKEEMIYEVAKEVGLGSNPQYFSQVFKKYTGKTPSEYKKQNIIDQTEGSGVNE